MAQFNLIQIVAGFFLFIFSLSTIAPGSALMLLSMAGLDVREAAVQIDRNEKKKNAI